jgi:hypothetical protein
MASLTILRAVLISAAVAPEVMVHLSLILEHEKGIEDGIERSMFLHE